MKIIDEIKQTEQPTAVAIGYFDGLHLGHRAVIETAVAAACARHLAPAVFTFRMPAGRPQMKQGGNILTESDKRALAAGLGVNLYIAPGFEEVAGWDGGVFMNEVLFKNFGATAICCGADFRFGHGRAYGAEELASLCRAAGAELIVIPAVTEGGAPISSTRIKAALAAGEMEKAARMLGRPYQLKLTVHADKHLAGSLGFPTINQRLPEELAEPRLGVYYTRALVGDDQYDAVSNLGRRPTVGGAALTLETHILDYSGQLYGREVTVELRKFLRDERRFENVEALKRAVERDIAAARDIEHLTKNNDQ